MYNGYLEAEVIWPDLMSPIMTTRALTVSDGHGRVKQIETLDLVILVNMCLYIVERDGFGLRAGDILSRNFDMTRQYGQDSSDLGSQVFLRYGSIYDARRGIGRIEGRYKRLEIPELQRWGMEVDWLIRVSWTLQRDKPDLDAQFIWVADQRIRKHKTDRADKKVAARELLARVSTLHDRTGRRNTSSLPLQLSTADQRLEARVQEVRGIGRRMDWRAVVLEHYLDQLERKCRALRRAAQDALVAKDLFGEERTPKALRRRANRMLEHSEILGDVQVRTFRRAFTHIARELEEISELLHDAADRRSADRLERVRELLKNVFESMVLAEQHWRMQEILLVAADHHHRKLSLSSEQISLFLDEVTGIIQVLTDVDPVTGQFIGSAFLTDVVPVVRGKLCLAKVELQNVLGVNVEELYRLLKQAAEPI